MARIGLLTTSYPRTPEDISGHFVAGFARALWVRGHQVEVLAPASAEPSDPVRAPAGPSLHPVRYALHPGQQRLFYGAGVPDNLRSRPYLLPLLGTFTAALFQAARARAHRWDAVISHWAVPCGLVGAQLGRDLPHLAVCHSADVHALTATPALLRGVRRYVVRHARAIWFVSSHGRDRFMAGLSQPQCRVHVQPMGFEPFSRLDKAVARRRARLRRGRFTALCLGRLVPIKQIELAIAAAQAIQDMDLIIAGDGPERARLQALARGCPRVRFTGTVLGEAKRALLYGCDALLLPSQSLASGRSEGMPTIILEALHAGLPVIARAVGGIPDWLHHGRDALLLPDPSVNALVHACTLLRQGPQLARRLSHQGQLFAQAHCWHRVAPMIEALLWR